MIEVSGFLKWDSDFFGFPVAFIEVGMGNDNQVKSELDRLFNSGAKLVYVYSHKEIELDGYDSVIADRKRSYILEKLQNRRVNSVTQLENSGIRDDLYSLAFQAGEHSRYRVDSHISEEDFKRLYRTWIDNSLDKGFADYVLGIIEPSSDPRHFKPLGLISAKRKGDELSIGLFATDENSRGKGIGSELIQQVLNIANKKGLKVEVTTQSDNETACRFYEKRGFKVKSETYVYHVWAK